ncbi:MAG: hypothetical protein V3U73_10905 [bacterium]
MTDVDSTMVALTTTTIEPLLILIVVIVLCLFLPVTALTYHFFRRKRGEAERDRVIEILGMSEEEFRKSGIYFVLAVFYSVSISFIGLVVLFLYSEIPGITGNEFPSVTIGNVPFPQNGSRLVFGMAFLGGYLWTLQHVFRRYSSNDLTPGVYYSLSIRMILASIIALVIYNAFTALAGGSVSQDGTTSGGGGGITSVIWPAVAFLIGMFPQRGLSWLTHRLPIFSPQTDPSVREMPLEMIEGIAVHDKLRLQEETIDDCYDLASADFVPLMLKTPYSARELVDWILQAKLCVYFGSAVKDLREHSIRTIVDLKDLKNKDLDALAKETSVTKSALLRAKEFITNDKEIDDLRYVGVKLGRFRKEE